MQKLARNRKGLSTVITTLIILVVSVLLAGVVTYYATNVTMTRTNQEEVRIRKPHIWVEEGDNAYAALIVQNLGGRDVLVDKITIRGVVCPWGVEVIATGDGTVSFFGTLDHQPITPETITIKATVLGQTVIITDTYVGPAGTLSGTDVSGTIDYGTGAWTLDFAGTPVTPPDVGSPITADYDYGVDVTKVYYHLVLSGEDVSGDFELSTDAGSNVFAHIGSVPADLAGWDTPSTDIPLKSSGSMLFFIKNPTNIALHDVGTTISLTVYTANAQWIVETNVRAAEIAPFP